MRMRVDRFKVLGQMSKQQIEHFSDLAALSGLAKNTVSSVLDSYDWKSQTVNKMAVALKCSPLELITVDDFTDSQN